MSYSEYGLNLNKTHLNKLKNSLTKSKGNLVLDLKKSNMVGSDIVLVTSAQRKKLDKGMPMKLTLSRASLKQMKGSGVGATAAEALIPIATDYYKEMKEEFKNSKGYDKIQNRLAYLRGDGVSSDFKKGILEAIKIANEKEMAGGGNVSDFFSGMKFFFTDPLGALELVGSEIEEGITHERRDATTAKKVKHLVPKELGGTKTSIRKGDGYFDNLAKGWERKLNPSKFPTQKVEKQTNDVLQDLKCEMKKGKGLKSLSGNGLKFL